jgi:hypothetical protein
MRAPLQHLEEATSAALAASPLLARLDPRERARLLACAEIAEIGAGAPVAADADAARSLHIVAGGAGKRRRPAIRAGA